jgi:3-methylcrotonyl-CoA carboxylase beta subunit
MDSLVHELKDLGRKIQEGGGVKAREKHVERGKLFVRDRVERLLDAG